MTHFLHCTSSYTGFRREGIWALLLARPGCLSLDSVFGSPRPGPSRPSPSPAGGAGAVILILVVFTQKVLNTAGATIHVPRPGRTTQTEPPKEEGTRQKTGTNTTVGAGTMHCTVWHGAGLGPLSGPYPFWSVRVRQHTPTQCCVLSVHSVLRARQRENARPKGAKNREGCSCNSPSPPQHRYYTLLQGEKGHCQLSGSFVIGPALALPPILSFTTCLPNFETLRLLYISCDLPRLWCSYSFSSTPFLLP